jgi:hypothetical protein
MTWLKYQVSYACGLGLAEYVEVADYGTVEEAKNEIIAEHYDGIRMPHFEVLEELPPEVLEEKIREATMKRDAWHWTMNRLIAQRKE